MEPYVVSEGTRRLAMALLMLTHIQIASFIIGGLTIGVTAEFLSLFMPRFRARLDRLGYGIAFFAVVIYSTGAVLAIVFIWLIAQLWPPFWFSIMRINVWPMVLEAITFALTIAFLFPYWYLWRHLERFKGVHLALGVAAVAVVHLQQAMIDVMAGYMLTPVPPENVLRVFLNPTAIPLDVHRTVGNISFAGFVIGAYAAVRALRARNDPEKRAYYDWLGGFALVIGLGFLFLQPAIGLFYLEEIRWHSPGAFNAMMRGRLSGTFLAQSFLLSLIFFLALLYLVKQTKGLKHPGATWLRILLVLNALGGLLLIQPYVVGPSQYTLWVRWVNPIGSMQPFKYIALAAQSLTTIAAVLIYLGGRFRELRLKRIGEVNRGAQLALIALGVMASLMMLLMGYIRESARQPFLIWEQVRIDSPQRFPTSPIPRQPRGETPPAPDGGER
ncbi:MAG: hypothetical protein ACOX6T_03140 [Myxococcales bacterium]|jgi:cytochrome d ubiquinol oxidase subunit I